ncbi:MAG TPA: c-type cytochrome domain-containing protein, partial [Vicinamibacterales bacterium]|nr:c-type cytochrome domain-containing protein [Vicinamibacterales bacterium]
MRATLAASLLLLVAGLTAAVHTQSNAARAVPRPATPQDAKSTIDRYCATCHNQRLRAGNLDFASLDVTTAGRDPQTWEKVIRKVRTGMMPPSGAPRPERATLDGFAASIETMIDR